MGTNSADVNANYQHLFPENDKYDLNAERPDVRVCVCISDLILEPNSPTRTEQFTCECLPLLFKILK